MKRFAMALALICAVSTSILAGYADWRQIRATAAANNIEHGQHVEHFA